MVLRGNTHSFNKMKFAFILLCGFILVLGSGCSRSLEITLETDTFRYVIAPDGKNVSFIDKASGTDYCRQDKISYCALVKVGESEYSVSSIICKGDRITLEFAEPKVTAFLKVSKCSKYVILEVESVKGKNIERLDFVNIPLTLSIKPGGPFAACSLALTTHTHIQQLPALQNHLRATCYRRFGISGVKTALIGVPQDDILPTIQEVLSSQTNLPYIKNAGAWAQDEPFNHGSYLFNFGTLTEETVDDWIDTVHSLGFNQIDNHGGGSRFFRFGDFHLNEEKWPEGWDTFKKIVAKLHDAGIRSIFHTYAFFIDKASKYVTPVPSQELGSFRSFKLAEPITAEADEITVVESTADVSTITGFFERNSVTLHIDDELITFSGITKEPPYRFTGCKRGAYGTKAAPHDRGSKARHLKECFGLFCPDPETELFEEIARNHAEIVDYCDFDGFYLDAIDGSDILGGGENAWYYGQEFVFNIYKHLKKPVSMEMSSMWHQMWNFRSRWQAWDYPNRGHKRFIDVHTNTVNSGLLLPLHLGWWNFQTFNPPQVEPSFPDVIEYMGCKLIGYNAGLSLTGAVNKENLRIIPAYRKLVNILKQYEELRHDGYFDESVKKHLREPGKEFTLFKDNNGKWRFKPARYEKHKIEGLNHQTSTWQVTNDFGEQPVKLRIEALMSAGPYVAPDNIVLADFPDENTALKPVTANGVTAVIKPSSDKVKEGYVSGLFTASNSGKVKQNTAWARIDKKFEPWLDLSGHKAIGVWIYGDGGGELINFRVGSPEHIAHGAVADRYVIVDFTGWRYFELIETESARWSDYIWNDGKGLYNVYRQFVDFKNIDNFSMWYNNLPEGKDARCFISPVKALPMVSNTLQNPSITVNGVMITFPVKMESGSYLEFYSLSDCILYGPKGEIITNVTPKGDVPLLNKGVNNCSFSCTGKAAMNPRSNVTIISYGKPL